MKYRNELRQAYDAGAASRDRSIYPDWKHDERARILSYFKRASISRLLEIGAGTGRDARFFADAGCEVVCVDLSPAMVQLCVDKGLATQVMDVAEMSFPDASFEAVYSFNSLLHLPKVELPSVLQEIRRVLVLDGLFYFGTYGGYDHEGVYPGDNHVPQRFLSFYRDTDIQHVVGQQFRILEFRSMKLPEWDTHLRFQSVLLQNSFPR